MQDPEEERTIAAAILGELIPEFAYPAPVLLERFERGELLVETKPPTDLGFDPTAVDHVLLDFFKALVPHVKEMLGWGVLGVIQAWRLSQRTAQNQAELISALRVHIDRNVQARKAVTALTVLLTQMDKTEVSANDVIESIAKAARRNGSTEDDSTEDDSAEDDSARE